MTVTTYGVPSEPEPAGGNGYAITREFTEGLRYLDSRTEDWASGNFLNVHNWWHLALYHLELGDHAAVLRLYDDHVYGLGIAGTAPAFAPGINAIGVTYDPIPSRVHFVQDPRPDLDDHSAILGNSDEFGRREPPVR